MGLQGHVINTPTKPVTTTAPATEVGSAPEAPAKKENPKQSTDTPKPNTGTSSKKSAVKADPTDTPTEQLAEAIKHSEETNAPKDQLYEVMDENGEMQLMTTDQMRRAASKGMGAERKFREAATMRKEAETILQYFKTNPTKALQELGYDVREMAENFLAEEIKKEMMSPEQREAMEWKRKAEEYEKQIQEAAEIAKQQKLAVEKERWAKKYDEDLTKALETSGLQKDPSIIRNVARIMHDYLEKGYEITAEEAVKEFQDSLLSQAATLIKLVGPEKATTMLGDDFMNSIRKEDIKKIKNPLSPSGDNGQLGARDVPKREKEPKLTIEEWKRRTRERIHS